VGRNPQKQQSFFNHNNNIASTIYLTARKISGFYFNPWLTSHPSGPDYQWMKILPAQKLSSHSCRCKDLLVYMDGDCGQPDADGASQSC